MESEKIIADIDSLLNMGVGDPYRIEHIKQNYLQSKSLYKTDENYLKQLREKYIIKSDVVQSDRPEHHTKVKNVIYCRKCGKKHSLDSNFCISCGSSLFEINVDSDQTDKPISNISKNHIETKTSTRAVVLISTGIFFLIITAIGYLFTIPDVGFTIPSLSNLCNSGFGQLGQMFNTDVQEGCIIINFINVVIHGIGLFGIIAIIVGLIKRQDSVVLPNRDVVGTEPNMTEDGVEYNDDEYDDEYDEKK